MSSLVCDDTGPVEAPAPSTADAQLQPLDSDELPEVPHGFDSVHSREWDPDDPMTWKKLVPRTLPNCDCAFCLERHVHHPWIPR